MSPFAVGITSRAMAEVAAISHWWTENRSSAPRLFQEELDAALLALSHQPERAPRVLLRHYPAARAWVLQRTGYVVLYDVDAESKTVTVMRVRHGKRRPLPRRPAKKR